MARTVIEYRCLLISPSDVDAERSAIADVVDQWNAQVGNALGARVTLVRWETHSVPDVSAPPQDILNQQIVDDSDFGIAIFWGRIGTPTNSHASGSIEEVNRLRTRGARVLIYFNSAPIPQEFLRDDQFLRLQEFKSGLQAAGILGSYNAIADLREQALLHLTGVVAWLLRLDRAQPSPAEDKQAILTAPKPDVRVVVYKAQLMPPPPGPDNILRVIVQNHSPVVVFVANVSIALRTGTMLMPQRDVVTGVQTSRHALQPGESYALNMDGIALIEEFPPQDILYVVVFDDVGREYRSSEESVQAALSKFHVTGR